MRERNNPLMKKIDKWVGCPIVYILGLLHKNNPLPQIDDGCMRIALIKTSAVGDTIILSAIIDEIRNQYPQCHITVICSKNNFGMVKILRGVNNIELFDMRSPMKSLMRIGKMKRFKFVLDFGPWPRINSVIAWKINADYRIGFKRADTYRHYIYDAKVDHLDCLHEIENYRNILRAAGFMVKGFIPDFKTKKHVIKYKRYVVFHMFPGGAMSLQRSWNIDKWIELGKYIYIHYGMTILLSGGKADKNDAEIIVGKFKNAGVNADNIAGTYNLAEMASVLKYAQVVISINTGIMHYAAAVGVPLIAIHGATSDVRWGPLSENAVVVKSGEACQPCISLGFESNCTKPRCMENVTVDMVTKELDKILED